ncbi:hypothetical protein AbraCBS73388_006415 [Aspergillus brasiliensis]|uniref:Uncharacterized protein n=1 Tax=Aspergillus brasiliensis TaxID=319629 RepID=A0A9W6DN37_9EURO|nr:hypothetical protein AbraCBS73388_006415 [Aspergillus brasiliensis]
MSPKTNESYPPTPPMPETDEPQTELRYNTSNDNSDRRKGAHMNEGRASGELEGSTLGSSSRDGDKGGRAQRRTPSSGGFLVDSSFLPRSRSLRTSQYLPRRSESNRKEKREAPEPDLVVPKKRSRFPWIRHKEQKASQVEHAEHTNQREHTEPTAAEEAPAPSNLEQDATPEGSHTNQTDNQATVGLDRDSLQIVNLALNLSESRKRNSLGRSASNRLSGGRWALAGGQPSASYTGRHASVPVTDLGQGGPQHGQRITQAPGEDRTRMVGSSQHGGPSTHAPSSVASLLPHSAGSEPLPQGFSESTLARAEKARRHFELFSEYLRLLPSLPPLQPIDDHNADSTSVNSSGFPSHRVYNPLQCIRNRKVRFRERCAIDTEAAGWYDTEKVHQWVDSVQAEYSQQHHGPLECLRLPSFHNCKDDTPRAEMDEIDHLAVSPPSSLRRASRASSVKARRPRSDWVIDPAEFLSDAAWVEEGHNKSKIVDRDGNNLYPDPSILITPDDDQTPLEPPEQLQNNRQSLESEHPASRTSLSDSRSVLATEFNRVGRGRRRHRFHGSGRSGHGIEASGKATDSKRHKLGLLSSSSSSISSADGHLYRKSPMDNTLSSRKDVSPQPGASRLRASEALSHYDTAMDTRLTPTHDTFPHYLTGKSPTWAWSEGKRSSISSIPSVDDRYDPLTTLATAESRSPELHAQVGIFPSIASNLSPPSSRSPSPTKGRFSRAIGARHERSKSNIRAKDIADDSSMVSAISRKDTSVGHPEGIPQGGRLEPSPLPDRVSSAFQEDPSKVNSQNRKDAVQGESKLRGIFKGPGKIAEKVGNEMSKVGDLILKKDNVAQSRRSSVSSTDTSVSDPLDDPEEARGDRMSGAKSLLRRFPTFSDDANRSSRRNIEKINSKGNVLAVSPFASTARQDRLEEHQPSAYGSPSKTGADIDTTDSQREVGGFSTSLHTPATRHEKPRISHELYTTREQFKKGKIKDVGVPFSLTRPPVTGLAQARADTTSSTQGKRPRLETESRSWSISNRSISSSLVVGVPGKREIERTRALLLSSGIKAREITRRAECVRQPPPDFLRRTFGTDASVPQVTRLYEYDVAAQGLFRSFEKTHRSFQRSIDNFSGSVSSPLRSQLNKLEDIINETISPRVQAATQDAEDLSIQLNTTSTLAVKQLSDTLDKGVRRRHRRLRWVRRTGFVMLEWALVGMLWWVWLIVMAFKILRGVFRGVLSGVRWVLWL